MIGVVDSLRRRIDEAAKLAPLGQLALDQAEAKLDWIVEVAGQVWGGKR